MATETIPLKECTTCKLFKPLTDFYKIPHTDKPRSQCRKCHMKSAFPSSRAHRLRNMEKDCQSSIKYYHANKERVFLRNVKRKYGITAEDYYALLARHNHACAICGQEVQGRKLHIDHNHKTGKIRGILCSSHNVGLGAFGDDINLLGKAIEYLRATN